MRICLVAKYPPIQGGVSARCYWLSRILAERGHQVTVLTNANEVEDEYRIWIPREDAHRLEGAFPSGGSVQVVSSGRFERGPSHIPYANPYVTKLAALTTEEIRSRGCEVLFSCYFEPYGMSAHLAAGWTGLPHVLQHAGSDRTRLMDHPELSVAYREILRRAAIVVTGDLGLEGLGIPAERLARLRAGFLPHEFRPDGPVLDIDALIRRLCDLDLPWTPNAAPLDPQAPTLGIYGKLGEAKGSYDLVAALARLRDRGFPFNFVAVAGGRERPRFQAAVRDAALGERTWMLPYLPHWRMPEFIRACTAVCFLERRFPIEIHNPGPPREIMACGSCAVLSAEVGQKQSFWPQLEHGRNALIVDEPADVDALAEVIKRVLQDPEGARAIGRAGAGLVSAGGGDVIGETYEGILERALQTRREPAPSHGAPEIESLLRLVRRHMPASVRALDGQIEASVHSFVARDDGPGGNVAARAMAFADDLVARVTRARGADLLAEVVRFERERLWLAVDVETERGYPAFPRVSAAQGATRRTHQRDFQRLHPVRSNWIRIGDFRIDAEDATRAVDEGRVAQLDGATTYVFQKRGRLSGRIFRINESTRELIALCDGTRTVAQVAELTPADPAATRKRLRELAKERVIWLR